MAVILDMELAQYKTIHFTEIIALLKMSFSKLFCCTFKVSMPGHAQLRRRNLDLSRPRRARGNGDNGDYALQNPSGGGGGGGGGGGAGDDEANVNPEAVGGSSWLQVGSQALSGLLSATLIT